MVNSGCVRLVLHGSPHCMNVVPLNPQKIPHGRHTKQNACAKISRFGVQGFLSLRETAAANLLAAESRTVNGVGTDIMENQGSRTM